MRWSSSSTERPGERSSPPPGVNAPPPRLRASRRRPARSPPRTAGGGATGAPRPRRVPPDALPARSQLHAVVAHEPPAFFGLERREASPARSYRRSALRHGLPSEARQMGLAALHEAPRQLGLAL